MLRWVLSEDRRSAVLAASSEGEAMCEEVISHCSISAFSGVVYYITSVYWIKVRRGREHTSTLGNAALDALTTSSPASFA